MIELNEEQVKGWIRNTLAMGGPFAAWIIGKTGVSQEDYGIYLQIAIAILPGLIVYGWGWWAHRKTALVATVAALPEVATVVIKDEANGVLAALAKSEAPAAKDVVTETQNEIDAKKGTKVP